MKNSGTVRMETKRLVLRPFVIEDAGAMFRNWANDPQVTKYLTWEPHKDVEETKQILEGWIKSYESKDFYTWAIARKEDEGNVIGSISVPQLDQKAGRGDGGILPGQEVVGEWNHEGGVCGADSVLFRGGGCQPRGGPARYTQCEQRKGYGGLRA